LPGLAAMVHIDTAPNNEPPRGLSDSLLSI